MLRRINQILCTVATVSSGTHTISHHLQALTNVFEQTYDLQNTCKPSFYVPANPPMAKRCLEYATVDGDGSPFTSEAKLKALLLQLINERQENPDSLPIVAAVGMSGTGKTCALRGLNPENFSGMKSCFSSAVHLLNNTSSKAYVPWLLKQVAVPYQRG